ncbi:hypothetical protein PPOLYM_04982 [Paenibacillus polymyxa]|jgi:hypothetical protein|uniref:Uncharacterized protein n=1 Tax=Paenibacillus peoriae TaxID=59893 RepID=A0ABU1QMU2_9BACL|nr:hypothetical protein [Paenibacillus sp. PvR133]MDR6780525.1 hypothetical protein [Paenibacillus peoriae]QYK65176.1 hypothetical protein KAI36_00281 [Paenibacillus sp. S02]SFR24917.1 hypothetical protein SAMN04488603_10979 [Paenibacillus sp. cl130]VUG08537.1 hypothetical protein PPOLYM_04982 [Paenibacillus polymyxa]
MPLLLNSHQGDAFNNLLLDNDEDFDLRYFL